MRMTVSWSILKGNSKSLHFKFKARLCCLASGVPHIWIHNDAPLDALISLFLITLKQRSESQPMCFPLVVKVIGSVELKNSLILSANFLPVHPWWSSTASVTTSSAASACLQIHEGFSLLRAELASAHSACVMMLWRMQVTALTFHWHSSRPKPW